MRFHRLAPVHGTKESKENYAAETAHAAVHRWSFLCKQKKIQTTVKLLWELCRKVALKHSGSLTYSFKSLTHFFTGPFACSRNSSAVCRRLTKSTIDMTMTIRTITMRTITMTIVGRFQKLFTSCGLITIFDSGKVRNRNSITVKSRSITKMLSCFIEIHE